MLPLEHYKKEQLLFLDRINMENYKYENESALAGVAQWTERQPANQSLVQFPVRTHAWVVGQVPSWGHARGNHTLMFLSLSFSLPSPLSKNKQTKSFLKKKKVQNFIVYFSACLL